MYNCDIHSIESCAKHLPKQDHLRSLSIEVTSNKLGYANRLPFVTTKLCALFLNIASITIMCKHIHHLECIFIAYLFQFSPKVRIHAE